MSYEFSDEIFWGVDPMVAVVDPRCAVFNEKAKEELRNAGIGHYTHQIKDCYFFLVADFTQPKTIIEAFNNWLHDYPNTTVIHMPEYFSCPIEKNKPPIIHNSAELFQHHIPDGIKIIFHTK